MLKQVTQVQVWVMSISTEYSYLLNRKEIIEMDAKIIFDDYPSRSSYQETSEKLKENEQVWIEKQNVFISKAIYPNPLG